MTEAEKKVIRFIKKMSVNLFFITLLIFLPLLVGGAFMRLWHCPILHITGLYNLDGGLTIFIVGLIIGQLTKLYKWVKQEWRDA